MTAISLGGPGAPCSISRVRRLLLGELPAHEREQAEQHLQECSRCQASRREIEQEKEALLRDVPFPQFAAGVAEKLAAQKRPRQWTAVIAAAAAILIAGVFVARPTETGVRSKGAAHAQVFVKDSSGVHPLAGDVPKGALLQIVLSPEQMKYAAAVLVESSESSVLYDGPALTGALPSAFEWDGSGTARLIVGFSDSPIDPKAMPPEQTQIVLHR